MNSARLDGAQPDDVISVSGSGSAREYAVAGQGGTPLIKRRATMARFTIRGFALRIRLAAVETL